MATFDEFYSSLDPDPGIRGKQFEKFVKWFLKNDPVWASQVKDIWLWNEHPKRSEWGPDCGIDLVFENFEGQTWAVQAKCFTPESSIKKQDMDSFISASDSRFQGRLLVASTDRIGKNAQRVLDNQKVVRFLLDDFRHSDIIFPQSPKELLQGKRKKRKEPRRHQKEAIQAVFNGLKNNNRGQLIMACGTGKTLTSLWIKEKIDAKQVLVLLPSLSLLSQTLREWVTNASKPFKWICVCSDKSVTNEKVSEDNWMINSSEIGVPVSSEIKEIKEFLNEKGSKVIFSTYQSSQLIVESQLDETINYFDIIFADEAHRCTGKSSKAFGIVLNENKIRAHKRLFLTATPKIISKQIKGKAKSMNLEIASMDDNSLFGNVLFELNFSKAIENDLLSDYQVVVIGVDDKLVKNKILNRSLLKIGNDDIIDAESFATQIALIKAIDDYDLKRIITFHGLIKGAEQFSKNLKKIIHCFPKINNKNRTLNSDYISGKMKSYERYEKLRKLEKNNSDIEILSNARCLGEGVDVPKLDAISFIDPKSSQVDIIQSVGRAIRKNQNKRESKIIIPVYIEKYDNEETILNSSRFKEIWNIILALKSQDDSLTETIDNFRIKLGKQENINIQSDHLEKIIFDMPSELSNRFSKAIRTQLIKNTSEDWLENYGELLRYYDKNKTSRLHQYSKLGTWISTQRLKYSKKELAKNKIKKLEIFHDWTWNILDEKWEKKFQEIQIFAKENGHSSPKQKTEIGRWVSSQREQYKKNTLPEERQKKLETVPFWIWDEKNFYWDKRLTELEDFYKKNKHLNIDQDSELAAWMRTQRKNYSSGILPADKIQILEKFNEWYWDANEFNWNQNYNELKNYSLKNSNCRPPRNLPLGKWVSQQRLKYTKNKLSAKQVDLFEKIKYWGWTAKKAEKLEPFTISLDWRTNYSLLQKRVKATNKFPTYRESDLGKWVGSQRKSYKEGKLNDEMVKLLEEINGWDWNPKSIS